MIRLELTEKPTPEVEVPRRQRGPTGTHPKRTMHPRVGTRCTHQRQAPGSISPVEAIHARGDRAPDVRRTAVDGKQAPRQRRQTDDVEVIVEKDFGESMASAALPREVLRGTLRPREIVFAMESEPAFFDGP